jgi:hypothetical protein
MPVGYPLVIVVGSKGGVGTTTLAAGLLQAACEYKTPTGGSLLAAGVDLTVTNGLAGRLGERAASIASLVRHRGLMPKQMDRLMRRKLPLLALDLEGIMYAERLKEMLRMLLTRRAVVVDAGCAFSTTGARPLAPYLSLASHVVLTLIPDVRAATRAERLLEKWQAHRAKIALVENMAEQRALVPEAIPIPKASSGSLGRLMKEPAGSAIRELAARLLPVQEVAPSVEQAPREQRGIIRSFVEKAGRTCPEQQVLH